MDSYWSLSDSKSHLVSRTLLSIQADLNNDVVWMVTLFHPISKSSCAFTDTFGIVPSALTTIGTTVTFMFWSFFFFLFFLFFTNLGTYLSFSFLWFSLCGLPGRQILFFYWLWLGLVVWQRLDDPFLSQNPKEHYASHSLGWFLDRECTPFSYGQIKIFAQFPVDHLLHPVVTSLLHFLRWFLHSLIRLIVLSLLPRNLHLLFCWISSIFAFT